ncbi:MAG: hypothetical protein ACXWL5_03815 [Candidatus Chromulinivorax sp.]
MSAISYCSNSSDDQKRFIALQSIRSATISQTAEKTTVTISRQGLSDEAIEIYTYDNISKRYTKETGNAVNGTIFEGSGPIQSYAQEFNNAKNIAQLKNQLRH